MGNTQKPPQIHQPAPLVKKPRNFRTTFCKYCTLQFPEGAIIDHENMCHKNPLHIFMTCSNCSKKLNLVDYQQHLAACEERNIKINSGDEEAISTKIDCEFCRNEIEIAVYMDHLKKCPQSPANRHTPCPFCQEKLPGDLVIKHAEFCNKNPENIKTTCPSCRRQYRMKHYEIHLKECAGVHSQNQRKTQIPQINSLHPKPSELSMKQSVCLPENECPICLCEIKKSDNVRFLACFHKYHNKCITDWSKKQSVCPICQIDIQS